MTKLADRSIAGFLEALASQSPVPGGGSAAALAGALGAGLFKMTCSLARTRNGTLEERERLDHQAQRLGDLVSDLLELVDQDARSFDAVMEALSLPRGTEEEKAARSRALQAAYREAAKVPFATAGRVVEAFGIGRRIIGSINPRALSDAGTAAALLAAALEGATLNVRANLSAIKDKRFIEETSASLETWRRAALEAREEILAFLVREGLG